MDARKLMAAGLDAEEADLYALLLERGPLTAGQALKAVKLKRSTLYQTLRSLGAKGLVAETDREGKILFSPESPDRLLERLHLKKDELARAEADLTEDLPTLRTAYLTSTERPILKFYQGIEGLKAIYESQLEGTKEIWFLRASEASAYERHFGKWWAHFIRRRVERGIVTHGLTPDTPEANHDPAIDKVWGLVRTWIRPEDYAAPVEIDVYGDTVAIISFGKDIFGLTMTNRVIAQSFLEMFKLVQRGAGTTQVKHDHD